MLARRPETAASLRLKVLAVLSADGKLLVSCSEDGPIHLWDVAAATERRAIFLEDHNVVANLDDLLDSLFDPLRERALVRVPRNVTDAPPQSRPRAAGPSIVDPVREMAHQNATVRVLYW